MHGYRVTLGSLANDPSQKTIPDSHTSSKCSELRNLLDSVETVPFLSEENQHKKDTSMNPSLGG